ncbi:MAG TPA: hypothetical protein DCX22_01400 [Dehalococcoidia bacterium]|nr:hypothetical protein [Dehalococcoidia bacterium]
MKPSLRYWLTCGFSRDQEKRYRQYYLSADIRHVTKGLFFLTIPLLAMVYNDYLFFGISSTLYYLAALRTVLLISGIVLILFLRRTRSYLFYDRWSFL